MKKLVSSILLIVMITSVFTFVSAESKVNEPTSQDLEQIIKIVKPKLDVPEQCSEFTWRFNAKDAYNEASWRFTWSSKDDSETPARVNVVCDDKGNISSYNYYDYNKMYGQLPDYSKAELEEKAEDFLKKALPDAYKNLKLTYSYGNGIYSGQFTYHYVRIIDGYLFPDNYINVAVDYNTGKVVSMNADYDYVLDVEKHETIISPEKAEEILGSKQKMVLTYLTKNEINKDTKERTVKAFLVYKPVYSYLAVDAGTGEIYDTKSLWSVNDSKGDSAAGAPENGIVMDKAESESFKEDYRLTEEELSGVKELEELISKEEAIKAVTDNPYLYINPALTAVSANLSKNYGMNETSVYQNDNGKYIWYISFSNPVIDDKYFNYAYADASVNAENGEIISFNTNLNDYYYYSNNKLDIPDVKFNNEQSRKIAEEFLGIYAKDKFDNTVETDYYKENLISRILENDKIVNETYGAHAFRYTRVNEGIRFDRNYINVGVDGVSGKIYRFNSNWWTNVEFESPKGTMSPEDALSCLISNDGYGVIYERNMTYIYTPVTDSSKKDICMAFMASFISTIENDGDIDKVIVKYAKNINKDKLIEIYNAGDEDTLFKFICEHFGVEAEEVQTSISEFVDTSMFYDKQATARLVYTCYDLGSEYVSPFTGKLLTGLGEEYVPAATSYTYSDIKGHWIENDALLLSDIGIGFVGGKFLPDEPISKEDFVKISQSMNFYTNLSEVVSEISRIEAIRLIVDSLGYEKVANLKGIYKTDFADNGEIKEKDLGYISIAVGFGIVKGDGTNINAYSHLTRAQAVSMLINAVKTVR